MIVNVLIRLLNDLVETNPMQLRLTGYCITL
jgi:hypothetical protein